MAGSSGGTGPLDNIRTRIESLQLSNKQEKAKHKFIKINEDVVGIYTQRYQLDYEEGAPISHGSVTMESGSQFTAREATFYILPSDEFAENVARRISDNTDKVTAGCNAVAKVYLVSPCKTLNTWIICYEKLDALLSENNIGMFPAFYDDNEVSDYWRDQISDIIDALNMMCLKSVSHGSMSSSESYAFRVNAEDGLPGEIKLIGVGKNNPNSKGYHVDLIEFVNLLGQYNHLNVSSNPSWSGFSYLVNSSAIGAADNKYFWAGKVKGHPLLLDPVMKVRCYVNIHVMFDQMTLTDKVGARDALYCLCPEFYDHYNGLVDLIQRSPICLRIYNRKKDVYGRYDIYTNMITFVRNLIKHGKQDFDVISQGQPWQVLLCDTVENVFPGFMSKAYAVMESGSRSWSQWHYIPLNAGRRLPFQGLV